MVFDIMLSMMLNDGLNLCLDRYSMLSLKAFAVAFYLASLIGVVGIAFMVQSYMMNTHVITSMM